jgi:hypothetical protein
MMNRYMKDFFIRASVPPQYVIDKWLCSDPPAAPGQSATKQFTATAKHPGSHDAQVQSQTDQGVAAILEFFGIPYYEPDSGFSGSTGIDTGPGFDPVPPSDPAPAPPAHVNGGLGYGPGWEVGAAPGIKAAALPGSGSSLISANPLDDSVALFRCQAGACTQSGKLMLPAGSNPFRTQIVDINGDGIGDVLTLNRATGTIGAFLTAGTRISSTPVISPVGAQPSAFALYSGSDGMVRAAVASSGPDTTSPGIITIFVSDGPGGFSPQAGADGAPVTFAVGVDPTAIVVADFNGDGNPDLAVVNGGSNTVSILLGDGTWNFTDIADLSVGGGPAAIAVADFNADGIPDLAIANSATNSVSVLFGNGSGSFSAATNFDLPQFPVSIAVADFDGDGFLDMAIVATGDDVVTLLMGDGTGGFHPGETYTPGQGPVSVVALDLNGDGKPDLAIANVASNTISFLVKK